MQKRQKKRHYGTHSASVMGIQGYLRPALIAVFIVIIILLIFMNQGRGGYLGESLRSQINDISAPIVKIIQSPFHLIQNGFAFFVKFGTLQADNIRLQTENDKLRDWYQTALRLDAENQALRSLLNVKISPDYNFITTHILMDTGSSYVRSALIDAGRVDGITLNAPVLSDGGVIGRILDVGKNTSRILLITDLNSKIPVTINSGQAQAIMTGYNIEYPVLKHVSNTSNSFEKAIVTTSGIGGVFPAGLPIGEVRFLRADPKDKESDLTMVVVPFSKMENIHMVRVLKGYFNPLEKIQDDFPEEKPSKKNKKEH